MLDWTLEELKAYGKKLEQELEKEESEAVVKTITVEFPFSDEDAAELEEQAARSVVASRSY